MPDDEISVTRAAKDIDPDAAFAAALDHDVYYERYKDVVHLQESAVQYASLTMGHALARIAMDAKGFSEKGRVQGEDGWHAFALSAPHHNKSTRHRIDLLMVNEKTPGGFLFTIKFRPELTPEATAIRQHLTSKIYENYEKMGISAREAVVREILGKDLPDTPFHTQKSALEKDLSNYTPLSADHEIEEIKCTALDMGGLSWESVGPGGRHPAFESWDVSPAKEMITPLNTSTGWHRGVCFSLRPPMKRHDENEYMTGTKDVGALPEIPMEILSGFIRTWGLIGEVHAANRIVGDVPWWTSNVGNYPKLEEAGRALVHTSEGLFDARVTARIIAFSQAIAASDVGKNVEEWRRTAEAMIAQGVTSEDVTFDCNDGRDIAYAGRTEISIFQVTETQHGTFRVDMEIGADDAITQINITNSETPVARFTATPDGWAPDYAARDDLPEIPHHIGRIRNLNTVVGSLSSVACVWEEEHALNDDEDITP